MAHHQLRPAHFDLLVLVSILSSLTSVTSTVYSVDDIGKYDRKYDHKMTLFQDINGPFDSRIFGQLNIDVLQATTSSIHVQWALTNVTYPDSVVESTVLCETSNGKIVSEKLHTVITSFHFQFLTSNTKYLICVYLLEKSQSTKTSILHFNCQPVSTIPIVRSDSILGVLLCTGYLLLMGAVGYITWYRRTIRIKRREGELKITIEDTEDDTEDINGRPVKASGIKRTGISNSVADDFPRDVDVVNGSAAYTDASRHTDSVGTCDRLDEDNTVPQLSTNKRQISY